MKFISYAQNLEDVILWRALKHIQDGFYIDVGAWSSQVDSVTRAFYERGWSGIDIEPNPEWSTEYFSHRHRDIFLNVALGAQRTRATIFIPFNSGLSTLDSDQQNSLKLSEKEGREIEVEVLSLKDIFNEFVKERDVHFLKIDVEGFEKQVILGNDWLNCRPWIVVVEATLPNSPQDNSQSWAHYLLESDYLLAYKDGLNLFFVAKEHLELMDSFSVPPNVFDNYTLATTEILNVDLQAHKEQVQILTALLNKCEAESLDRFNQINNLTTLINNIEAESLDRFNQIQTLNLIIDKLQKS